MKTASGSKRVVRTKTNQEEEEEDENDYTQALLVNGPVSPGAVPFVQPNWPAVSLDYYWNTTLFIVVHTGVYLYWLMVLINTIYTNEYANFSTPPLPGVFSDSRYGWEWWPVWLLGLNVFLPFALQFAMLNNHVLQYSRMHRWFSTTAMITNLVAFALLTVLWLVRCNNTYSGSASMCNDYRWCGVYFPSQYCPNAVPFVPAVSATDLSRNSEASQHWIFSLVFWLLAWWHTSLNGDLREYGVLH